MEYGIVEGEKLITEEVKNLGSTVNGWKINLQTGKYGLDYLLRAAIANTAIGANVPEEAEYPIAFTDSEGKELTGADKYVIHFNKDRFPPVEGFWSITMYNDKVLFVDDPLNRYFIVTGLGLKYNEDGSLDIYILLVKEEMKHFVEYQRTYSRVYHLFVGPKQKASPRFVPTMTS